tara:strand:- start:49 stop:951 length:903 start_codon:yes stop_codon:yes gene_type:complete
MKKTFNICEICKSNQWEIIYFGKIRDGKYGKQKNNATISQCSKCGIQRLNEKDCIPSEYYDSGEYRKKLEQSLIGEKAVKDQMDVQKFMLNAIGGLNVLQNQNIADVGCGAGSLLYMTNRVVKSQIAIEPCRPYFEFLKNKGYKVYPDLSSAIKENNQTLDWVLSSQVIEHVESPVEFLKEIYKLLKPGGEAMISTPNRNDILINLLDEFKEFFYRTQHRWYFDKNCIEYCIKKVGFEILETKFIHRYGLANAIYWLRDREPKGKNRIKVLNQYSDKFWESYLESTGQSDNLFCHLRRPI